MKTRVKLFSGVKVSRLFPNVFLFCISPVCREYNPPNRIFCVSFQERFAGKSEKQQDDYTCRAGKKASKKEQGIVINPCIFHWSPNQGHYSLNATIKLNKGQV